jgi:type I restriction enzyme S subunit
VARSQDIRSGTFRAEEAVRVSETTYVERIARAEPIYGDLLYSREGTYFGIAAEVPEGQRVCLGQRMVLIRPDPREVNFRFLRYWLNSPIMARHLEGFRDGSVAQRLNMPTIRALPIPAFSIYEQRRIASLLGALDDKIELNRRMNETLEGMARALFRSWFVDFDPVHARAAGEAPAHMPPETAALFPARFNDDGLPEGWGDGVLGDVADASRRGVHPSQVAPETPYIGLEHMPKRTIALDSWESAGKVGSQKSIMRVGEFLFGKLRPYFHKVGIVPVDGICSTDIVVVRPRSQAWAGFVLAVISSDEFVDFTNASSSGTRMPRTNWKDMARFRVAIPTADVADAFEAISGPWRDKILQNIHESRTLAALRDALLPKLMSGELRVRDAEAMVEGVA